MKNVFKFMDVLGPILVGWALGSIYTKVKIKCEKLICKEEV